MRILICPLDWGLGHATRCVPIVREFLKRNDEVFLASSGPALAFLKLEFPDLTFFELPGYRPSYTDRGLLAGSMIRQLPRFIKVIAEEHQVTRELDTEYQFDLIISDNRYGCWSKRNRSIMITHQTRPVLPNGFRWGSSISNGFSGLYLKNFAQLWIPDQPGGEMTNPFNGLIKQKHRYVGWLSRFSRRVDFPIKYKVLVMISGPEPQRSIFKKIMMDQLKRSGLKSMLVAGDPDHVYQEDMGMLKIVSHLESIPLEEAIQSSELVISRSGYSTIMDLIALGKKAILIPTPGQTEQEILADYLMKNHVAYSTDQEKFSLTEAIEASGDYAGFSNFNNNPDFLMNAINTSR